MNLHKIFQSVTCFIWDKHNQEKNWQKHRVTVTECEEVFVDKYLTLIEDRIHSSKKQRWAAFGQTTTAWHLSVAFTIRDNGIRVISARPMSRKERRIYAKTEKDSNL